MRMELLLFTSSQVHIKRTHKIVIAIINKLPMPNHFRNLFFQPYTFNAILAITMLPIVMEKVTKTLHFNPLPPYYDVIIFAASDK